MLAAAVSIASAAAVIIVLCKKKGKRALEKAVSRMASATPPAKWASQWGRFAPLWVRLVCEVTQGFTTLAEQPLAWKLLDQWSEWPWENEDEVLHSLKVYTDGAASLTQVWPKDAACGRLFGQRQQVCLGHHAVREESRCQSCPSAIGTTVELGCKRTLVPSLAALHEPFVAFAQVPKNVSPSQRPGGPRIGLECSTTWSG